MRYAAVILLLWEAHMSGLPVSLIDVTFDALPCAHDAHAPVAALGETRRVRWKIVGSPCGAIEVVLRGRPRYFRVVGIYRVPEESR